MKVYRIEHKDWKIGPYISYAETVSGSDYFGDRCPGPSDDGITHVKGFMVWDHYFGFAKMKQMFVWFRARDVFRMRKEGFRVYRYKVDDAYVAQGFKQLAFIRTKATVREEVKLSLMARHLCGF